VLTGHRQSPVSDRIIRQVHVVDITGVQTRVHLAHCEGSSGLKGPDLRDIAETSDLESHHRFIPCA